MDVSLEHTPPATAGDLPCTAADLIGLSAELLRAGVAVRFRARGASMGPLLRDGDVLWVQPVEPGSLRVGDVVLCSSAPGRVVVHRVVRKLAGSPEPRFVVQGDQLAWPDGVIPAAQVYGRAVAVERDGVRMAMDRGVPKWLGRLAALRSRWNLGRGPRFDLAWQLFKSLPFLSRYLA